MPITSESEFEAVLSRMIRRLSRIMHYQGKKPKLEAAVRSLKDALESMLEGHGIKLEPEEAKALIAAAETVRSANLGDDKLEDDSWEIEDYLTYRM